MKPVSEKNNFLYLTVGIVVLLLVGAVTDQFEGLVSHQLVLAFSVINIVVAQRRCGFILARVSLFRYCWS